MAKKIIINLFNAVAHTVPLIVWQVASLVVVVILIKMLVGRASTGRLLSMVCLGFCMGGIIAVVYHERSQRWIQVPPEGLIVYMGPGTQYPRLNIFKTSGVVRVVKSQSEKNGIWLQIEDNDRRGWIENEKNFGLDVAYKG